MQETMLQLHAAPVPRPVYGPYKGRAFPFIEKFYTYPHNVQPPESLAREIHQIPASTSASLTD
jgi:hypothetical protein